MVEVPGYVSKETWAAFCEMRRLKGARAPFTEFAARRIIDKLKAFHAQGYDADHILGEAVERGWSSVFLTAETPKRNVEADKTAAYLADLKAHGAPATAEQRAKLEEVRQGAVLKRVS